MLHCLYLSSAFPPIAQVGGLRAFKFSRYLPSEGWRVTVLCAPVPAATADDGLLAQLPADVRVVRGWGRPEDTLVDERSEAGLVDASGATSSPLRSRLAALRRRQLPPDFLPLGRREIPRAWHGLASAEAVIVSDRPDVILASIDPEATMVAGARLSQRHGIPLVLDFRDPWATCDLRRGARWPLQRRLVDALERGAIEQAAAVIWNTETARTVAAEHYGAALAAKFAVVRNHHDSTLVGVSATQPDAQGPFRVLILGRLRKYVEGAVLFRALARLRASGITPAQLLVEIAGTVPIESLHLATALGVRDYVEVAPALPHARIGSALARADLLLALSNASVQRIPSKLYDYLATDLPVLVLADNPEIASMTAEIAGVQQVSLSDDAGLASSLAEALSSRGSRFPRDASGFDSRVATQALSVILKQAVAHG
ncbi:MAG: glycosyltransferase [Deltaproteobacteria bacterium]|nr:glycosyltransferase [Deltaproteobacteria bacterium]